MKIKEILIALILIFIDIITKQIIIHNLDLFESITIIPNFLQVTYVRNTGVAFSLLEGNIPFIVIFTLLIVLYIIHNFYKLKYIKKIPILFILSGAIGNLIDRIIYGYVIDFIEFSIGKIKLPIFNIADIYVVLGVLILLWITYKEEVKNGNKN